MEISKQNKSVFNPIKIITDMFKKKQDHNYIDDDLQKQIKEQELSKKQKDLLESIKENMIENKELFNMRMNEVNSMYEKQQISSDSYNILLSAAEDIYYENIKKMVLQMQKEHISKSDMREAIGNDNAFGYANFLILEEELGNKKENKINDFEEIKNDIENEEQHKSVFQKENKNKIDDLIREARIEIRNNKNEKLIEDELELKKELKRALFLISVKFNSN